jgi:hypothetical protein
MSEASPEEWALQTIRERTEAEIEGNQMHTAAVWTICRRDSTSSAKPSCPHSKDEIDAAGQSFRDDDRVVYWHGLLAPADPEHIAAIIQNELEADFKRKILIGHCNRLRQEVGQADA